MENYVINMNQVSSEVFDNEAVVVNFMTGKYYGLSGSGAVVWQLFQKPASPAAVMNHMDVLYPDLDVDSHSAISDFIDSLIRENLLVTSTVSSAEIPQPGTETTGAGFKLPVLEIYDDLQELIVLDPIHDTDPERGWPTQQHMRKP